LPQSILVPRQRIQRLFDPLENGSAGVFMKVNGCGKYITARVGVDENGYSPNVPMMGIFLTCKPIFSYTFLANAEGSYETITTGVYLWLT